MKKTAFFFCLLWTLPLLAGEFPYIPPKNFTLDPASIVSHHPVTTTNPLAQLYFDQGLTLIYAFNHDAAFWSFLKAAELDRGMAMAYWGMALAVGSNINMSVTPDRERVAFNAIQSAKKLSSHVTEAEKDYIQALSTRYSNAPKIDIKQLDINYKNAMEELSKKYPDDLDAQVLYGESVMDVNPWHQWSDQGEPLEGTLEIVKTLESVLKRNPNHLGANHYFIHTIEASKNPERGLMSAHRLEKLLPFSGHILHMPSHIYLLVGDYHRAAESNENAVFADKEYIRRYGMYGIYPLHYLSHNLYFLSRAYSMEGRLQDAKRAADELVRYYNHHFKEMPDLEYYAPTSMLVLLRFQQWKDVLNLPEFPPEMKTTNVLWHFARGVSAAALGDLALAKEEQEKFSQERDKILKESKWGYNDADPIVKIADLVLRAKISEVDHSNPSAIDYLREAVTIQDALHYNEPPDWFFPVRESLGGVFLRDKQYKQAEEVFRQDLERHPRNGRSLFGLLESLKAQSKTADAWWVQQAFEKAWKYSDMSLSVPVL